MEHAPLTTPSDAEHIGREMLARKAKQALCLHGLLEWEAHQQKQEGLPALAHCVWCEQTMEFFWEKGYQEKKHNLKEWEAL